jgi:hypothetical protein
VGEFRGAGVSPAVFRCHAPQKTASETLALPKAICSNWINRLQESEMYLDTSGQAAGIARPA